MDHWIALLPEDIFRKVRHLKQMELRQESVTTHEGLAEALRRLGDKVPEIYFCDCIAFDHSSRFEYVEIEILKDACLLPRVSMSFQGGCQASQTAGREAEKPTQRARTKRNQQVRICNSPL